MHFLTSILTSKPHELRVPSDAQLVGPRVMLREAETGDWRSWRGLRDLSRDFLKPWEPEWPSNSLTSSFFDGMLRRQWRDWRQGKAYGFLVFLRKENYVIPAKAGIQRRASARHIDQQHSDEGPLPFSLAAARSWIPAFAGMTSKNELEIDSPLDRGGILIGGISLNDIRRGIAQKATLGYWIGMPYAGQGLMTEAAGLVCDFAFDILKLNRVEASCMPNNEPSKRLLKRLDFVEEGYAKSYLRIDGEWQDHELWGKTAG